MKRFRVVSFFIILFLLNIILVNAQKAPIKWGKFSETELTMTTYLPDTQANALVLCDFGSYSFDFGVEGPIYRVKNHRRIKILKRAGFDQGDISLSYYKGSGYGLKVKAHVIQPDGTKTEIDKKDIFDEQVYENWYRKKIAFPNLTEGCIIEYESSYTSPRLSKLPTWYFQEDIPVLHNELRVVMPDWFNYAEMVQGHETLTDRNSFRKVLNTRYGGVDADYSTYIAKDVPALVEESHITNMNDYRMRIKFQLKAIEIPGQYYETVMTNWNDIAKGLVENEYFGSQYLKNKYVKDIVEELAPTLAKTKSKQEKLSIIYYYLANNVAWNGSYDYTCDQHIDKSFEEKSANSAEINLMLVALLRANDIQAFPVLTSTRSYGRMFPIYPFLDQFDHILVYATIDEKPILMDIPDRDRPIDLLKIESLNKQGLVITDDKQAQWIDITPSNQRNVMMANLKFGEEGELLGEIQCNFKGYEALIERKKARVEENKDGKYWTQRFEKNIVGANVSNIEYENLDAIQKPLKEKMNCQLPDFAQVVDDYIYVSPIFYSSFMENPFKLEKRSYPVDYAYPTNEQTIINLVIPEGYIVEDLPESINLSLPDRAGKFMFSTSIPQEGMVQLVMNIKIKKLTFLPDEYPALKNFFDMVVEKQQEQIVLKKKDS